MYKSSRHRDVDLLAALQRDAFGYFLNETNLANGLVIDKTREDWPASIAAIGLALGANHGIGGDAGGIVGGAAGDEARPSSARTGSATGPAPRLAHTQAKSINAQGGAVRSVYRVEHLSRPVK